MFCALVALIILFTILIVGVTISAIDIEVYNFGLYYALLAIVGIMISCAICIVKPPSIKNPLWYDRCCRRLASHFEPARQTTTVVEMSVRRNLETPSALRQAFNRIGTVERLAPAFELVHIMLKGMATPIVEEEHENTHDDEESDYCHRHRSSSLPDLPKVRVVDESYIIFYFRREKILQMATRSPSAIKEALLSWCQAKTRGYKNVDVKNFSSSWADGMAFCALIHHFYPESFDFDQLDPKEKAQNLKLAFETADKKADIMPLLEVEDMLAMGEKPDWKCIFTYVQCIYRQLRNQD